MIIIILGTAILCLLWLALLLVRRKAVRQWPWFFVYIIFSFLSTTVRLLTTGNYSVYFRVFWCTEALFMFLGLAAIDQVFRRVYGSLFLLAWFRLLYFGVIALAFCLAIRSTIVHPPVGSQPLIGLLLEMGIAVNLLQSAIVVVFLVLARPLKIGFPNTAAGIMAGFGITLVGWYVVYLMRIVFGGRLGAFATYVLPATYLAALVAWITTFTLAEIGDSGTFASRIRD